MGQPVMQHAFHAGEWAPALNARVDLAKYHSGAALLENFFVDYRGGASTRTGSRYVLQAYKSATAVRLIPFSASFTVDYLLEFGNFYIRFYNNGAPVLEAATTISGATQANPCVIHDVAHGYTSGNWVQIAGVVGMTQLNGNFYSITVTDANHYSLQDLNGNNINSTAYSAYTSGGTAQRVYTLPSPYAAADLRTIKFAQSASSLILCHPNYQPYVLTLITATNWTILPIMFGTTMPAPTGLSASTTLSTGTVNYSYIATAVDVNGQESGPSTAATLLNKTDLRTVAGTNQLIWNSVSGAVSYNVYKAEPSYSNPVPAGAAYGFIGNCTGTTFEDSNIGADFSTTPPIPQNPFQGAGLQSVTVTTPGTYTTAPTATVAAAPAGGQTATVSVVLGAAAAVPDVPGSGSATTVGTIIFPYVAAYGVGAFGGLQLQVTAVNGSGQVTSVSVVNPGSIASGTTPSNPVAFQSASGLLCQIDITWGVVVVSVINPGAGYTSVPGITFSAGSAAATAVLATASSGNPSACGFFQQRLVLAGLASGPAQFYMSQPGAYYNFNISNPVQADDAISGTIVASQLNSIKAMVSMPTGLLMLTDKALWLINGGSAQEAVTPSSIVANQHSYNGASDVPPIVANFDICFVQSKGSIVRDAAYNFYFQIFTGTDISVLSSHLFFGHTIEEWAWAEEPFKVVWAIREDGVLLSLTFMKEQELIGWAHSITQGLYNSVATVVELHPDFGYVDAVYVVVQRVINGNTVQYIERFGERHFHDNYIHSLQMDAAIAYQGAPATTFSGAQHLAGATVIGLADGVALAPFTMPVSGTFTLANAASDVIVGLAYTPKLQTLALNMNTSEGTVQGKRKKITGVTVRVADALGLQIGTDESNLVNMDDLVVGNVGSATNTVVTGLVTGDARQIIDPNWTVEGQYYIEQPLPYPATVLGVIPEVSLGDTAK